MNTTKHKSIGKYLFYLLIGVSLAACGPKDVKIATQPMLVEFIFPTTYDGVLKIQNTNYLPIPSLQGFAYNWFDYPTYGFDPYNTSKCGFQVNVLDENGIDIGTGTGLLDFHSSGISSDKWLATVQVPASGEYKVIVTFVDAESYHYYSEEGKAKYNIESNKSVRRGFAGSQTFTKYTSSGKVSLNLIENFKY